MGSGALASMQVHIEGREMPGIALLGMEGGSFFGAGNSAGIEQTPLEGVGLLTSDLHQSLHLLPGHLQVLVPVTHLMQGGEACYLLEDTSPFERISKRRPGTLKHSKRLQYNALLHQLFKM